MGRTVGLSALTLAAFILAGCSSGGSGGGSIGGGSPPPDEPGEPVPRPTYSLGPSGSSNGPRFVITEDYEGNPAGSVEVAVVDSGIDQSHGSIDADNGVGEPIFSGGFDANAIACEELGGDSCGSVSDVADEEGHGTAVASIVAGNLTGYAGNARIVGVDASDRSDGSSELSTLLVATSEAADRGIGIVNASYSNDLISGKNLMWDLNPSGYYGQHLENVRNSDVVYVTSAGNESEDYSKTYNTASRWSSDDPLIERTLLVGALNDQGSIASYSAGPGADERVQSRFIVAPGTNEAAAIQQGGDQYQDFTGTSSAAPVVSAGLASVMAGWSHLSAVDSAQILLDTADQSFTTLYGNESCGDSGSVDCGAYLYGMGALDVEAALTEPVGPARLATGNRVESAHLSADESFARLDGAMAGAAPMLADALSQVVIFDDYGRDFQVDLSGQVAAGSLSDHGDGERALDRVTGELGADARVRTRSFGAVAQRYQFTGDNAIARMDLTTDIGPVGLSAFQIHDQDASQANTGRGLGPDMAMLSDADSALSASGFNEGVGLAAATEIGDALTFDLRYTQGEQLQWGMEEVALTELNAGFALGDDWTLHMGFSQAREEDGLLGLRGEGALGTQAKGATTMPSIGLAYTQDDWSAFASYARAKGNARYADSLIESVDVTLERLSAGVDYAFGNDRQQLGVLVSTPLHIRAGSASLAIPSGRTDAGEVRYDRRAISLEPSNTPLDMELGYRRVLSEHAEIGANLLRSERNGDAGHQASVNTYWRF